MYIVGRTWPVFLVSSVVVICVTVIVCIVFNSFYAINSSDKLEIAHLRFAQFRKLLHIAIFFSPLLLFVYHIWWWLQRDIAKLELCFCYSSIVCSQTLVSSAMNYAQSLFLYQCENKLLQIVWRHLVVLLCYFRQVCEHERRLRRFDLT